MNEEYEQNDSNINDFQEELNNDFKQESMNNSEEENELEDDTYQYIADIKEMAQKDFSKYINKQLTPNRTANNKLVNNLNFKYANENYIFESSKKQNISNTNEDISGISLLKELEEQWNNVEKQKNYNKNKNDESTYSNSKSNYNYDKFKYITDIVELKKNKFLNLRQKAKKERNEDQEIEQYFLNKLNEMEKYKIIDEDLKKKIEIRQQEKFNEENYEQNNNNDIKGVDEHNNENYEENIENQYNFDENEQNNYEDYTNENTFNRQQYLKSKEKFNLDNNNKYNIQNKNPELDDLVYETPARTNYLEQNVVLGNINSKNDYESKYPNENEDNVNIGNITRPEKNIMSGKLFDKMKNLYQEINGDNNLNTNKKSINDTKFETRINNKNNDDTYESGVLGINNINLKENQKDENIILKNIRNNNDNGQINDANKSINFNFNYINNDNFKNQKSPLNQNIFYNEPKYEQQNKIVQQNDIFINEENNLFKDKNRMTLSGLQENFDDILQKVKSNHNKYNLKENKINLDLFNNNINNIDYDEEDFNKYFEELSNEAKLNIKKNKKSSEETPSKNKFNNDNKILKKIEENSSMLNNFITEMNQNRNRFKQRMMELNNNLNNIRKKENINNESFLNNKDLGIKNINNKNKFKRNLSEYKFFSNDNY